MSEVEKNFKKYRTERLLKECPVCSDLYHGYKAGHGDQQEKIDELGWQYEELMKRREQVRKLKKALEFYADDENYDWEDFEKKKELIMVDYGKRARETLKEIK